MIAVSPHPSRAVVAWRGTVLGLLAALAATVVPGGIPVVPLPALSGPQGWALESVALIGLCAWYAAGLLHPPAAANDDTALGRGGRPFPIAD